MELGPRSPCASGPASQGGLLEGGVPLFLGMHPSWASTPMGVEPSIV